MSIVPKSIEIARGYLHRGWSVLPIALKQKAPRIKNWPSLRLSEADLVDHFDRQCNIGVLQGDASGGLIDIDLDHLLAIRLADQILPKTCAEFGRASKPRSHRLYRVTSPIATCQREHTDHGMIAELRSTGTQTVFPGSIHPGGEPIEWFCDGEPAVVDPKVLSDAFNRLADEVIRELNNDSELSSSPSNNRQAPSDVLCRARAYATSVDGSVEGARNKTGFRLAAALTNDFRLSDTDAWTLLEQWNQRNLPPLSEVELRRTFDSARQNAKYTPGSKLTKNDWKQQPSEPVEIQHYRPFPVDALPGPVRTFVLQASSAIGCDSTYVALPALASLASAIGNSRRVRLKRGYDEPAILWTAIVGESGTLKSPAFRAALRPIRDAQADSIKEYEVALKQHEQDLMQYEKDLMNWKKDPNRSDSPPEKPEEPQAVRFLVSDTTIEALAPILKANWRGVLVERDELAGWVGSFNQYKGGRGGDSSHWLSMYAGDSICVDRKTGKPRLIFVPMATTSVTGTIQPGVLARAFSPEHRESGLLARILLAFPPPRPAKWTEAEIPDGVQEQYQEIVKRLLALEPDEDAKSEPIPAIVGLSAEAKEVWVGWHDQHAERQAELTGDAAAAMSKIKGGMARLALIIHLVRWVDGDSSIAAHDVIDAATMRAAATLANWFAREMLRIYAVLEEGDEEREARQLIEWIGRKGGRATVHDLTRGPRRFRGNAAEAERALDDLAKSGHGHWIPAPSGAAGGRPTRVFELAQGGDGDETPEKPEQEEGFVAVTTVATSETEDAPNPEGRASAPSPEQPTDAGDEWGEV